MKVSNWGNFPSTEANVLSFATTTDALQALDSAADLIPRGLGRCYGDSSLSSHIISTLKYNRFLEFDQHHGILHCQSGLSFAEILDVIVPAGWFLPVTPGTKFVTVGGAIAADVHGKNHHGEGSFSKHVIELQLLAPSGLTHSCSRTENADIFWATCGGMGLTGIILEARFKLKKIETAYIVEERSKATNVDELFRLFESSSNFTYSVAWIDCLAQGKSLGRGIMLNGEHALTRDLQKPKQVQSPLALPKKGKLSIPFNLPSFTINPLTVKAFNTLYYSKAKRGQHRHVIDYETYFYPLDTIHHWNRVYGRKGFVQYQFAMPPSTSYEGVVRILKATSQARMPSFVSVLKTFGDCETGMIGFPMEGYMLALDFPITKFLFPFLDRLDEIVAECGGRLYLTKDSRMKPEMFRQGYPRLQEFLGVKLKVDGDKHFQSLQSKRLGI
jgi:decaprenylphospho-beta-D-ribofuranose 2-oxidase